MSVIVWALDRLLPRRDIDRANGCPYLTRWVIRHGPSWSLYVHRFVGDDDEVMHDHPKRFVSIGLSGAYDEDTPAGTRRCRAPWVRTFGAEHKHRVRLVTATVWTLVWTGRYTRMWGFWPGGRFVPWLVYVARDHGIERDCG